MSEWQKKVLEGATDHPTSDSSGSAVPSCNYQPPKIQLPSLGEIQEQYPVFNSFSIQPATKQISKKTKKVYHQPGRFCKHCNTTKTPQWRRGPDGRKSLVDLHSFPITYFNFNFRLCNACGLHFQRNVQRERLIRETSTPNSLKAILNHAPDKQLEMDTECHKSENIVE